MIYKTFIDKFFIQLARDEGDTTPDDEIIRIIERMGVYEVFDKLMADGADFNMCCAIYRAHYMQAKVAWHDLIDEKRN